MKDPQFWADVIRITDLAFSCLAAGALGYALVLFGRAYRRDLRPDANLPVVVLFSTSYFMFLLAGIASDIQRVHSPLTLYLPLHLTGAILAVPFMLIGAGVERRRLAKLARSLVRKPL